MIFCDLFDTIIHRKVHPNYVFRIWAKLMIRELGLSINVDELYQIRASSSQYLCSKENLLNTEISNELVINEVYKRLNNSELILKISYDLFKSTYIEADYKSEISTQFLNKKIVDELTKLRKMGYNQYLITDIHHSESLIQRILSFHGLNKLFDGIYVSSALGKSKQRGDIYELALKGTDSDPGETVMIGDNKHSDLFKAQKSGLHTIYQRQLKHKIRNKLNLFGNEKKAFNTICKNKELKCRKSEHLFSEYIIYFYFFVERLYTEVKKKGIKNLFFLAREGLYLKKLFDYYQEVNGFDKTNFVSTHYFKASRQSALLVSLKPLYEEPFEYIKNKYDEMSLIQFLEPFRFSEEVTKKILDEVPYDAEEVITEFVSSEVMANLRSSKHFIEHYDLKRLRQKQLFKEYLDSFDVDYPNEGINLVDVGWGGTMQEGIYNFLQCEVSVQGYYLGLKEIYNIEEKTKRFGMNFSVYPSRGFSDYILAANGQLYEQLLAAHHGSAVFYVSRNEGFVHEYHEEKEKTVFENFIAPIQDFMFAEFKSFNENLEPSVYSQDMIQSYITDMALRLGILTTRRKLKFIHLISQGFYQNVGNNKVGLAYDPNAIGISKKKLLKLFLWSPEKIFRYLVKVKPLLYAKGKYWLGIPFGLVYYYIRLNRYVKSRFFKKQLI
ncbi:HAD hydrolase-like protein [Ulvibacterium marinum]|uniref:HAD hydrolase-like protein n=1 Tax=Ulvibacterium marinum TaxID=2419782 RepID=UPI0037440D75